MHTKHFMHLVLIYFGIFLSFGDLALGAPAALEITQLITAAEAKYAIPKGLLASIAQVESGLEPFALNIGGRSVIASSCQEAVSYIQAYQKQAHHTEMNPGNIDLGVMQLNLRWHGENFASLHEMLEPRRNIEYAAQLLATLKKQHNSWHTAVRYYHSASAQQHKPYSRKVILAWLVMERNSLKNPM